MYYVTYWIDSIYHKSLTYVLYAEWAVAYNESLAASVFTFHGEHMGQSDIPISGSHKVNVVEYADISNPSVLHLTSTRFENGDIICSFGGGLVIHEWKNADEVFSREISGTFMPIPSDSA